MSPFAARVVAAADRDGPELPVGGEAAAAVAARLHGGAGARAGARQPRRIPIQGLGRAPAIHRRGHQVRKTEKKSRSLDRAFSHNKMGQALPQIAL